MHGRETFTEMHPPVTIGPGGEFSRHIYPKPYFTPAEKIYAAIATAAILVGILFATATTRPSSFSQSSIRNSQSPRDQGSAIENRQGLLHLPESAGRCEQPATSGRGWQASLHLSSPVNLAGRGGGSTPYPAPASYTRQMIVTAYCPCEKCCGRWADGITASGKPVTANEGRFVAAPVEYPYNFHFWIPGYNGGLPVPVLDRGGAIKGNRLDVFFGTHAEALAWGRQTLDVTIQSATETQRTQR